MWRRRRRNSLKIGLYGSSNVTVVYGDYMILCSMMYGAKLTGEDLSRRLNKIESVSLRKA